MQGALFPASEVPCHGRQRKHLNLTGRSQTLVFELRFLALAGLYLDSGRVNARLPDLD